MVLQYIVFVLYVFCLYLCLHRQLELSAEISLLLASSIEATEGTLQALCDIHVYIKVTHLRIRPIIEFGVEQSGK